MNICLKNHLKLNRRKTMKILIIGILSFMSSLGLAQLSVVYPTAINAQGQFTLTSSQSYVYLQNQGSTRVYPSLSISSSTPGISLGINRCTSVSAHNTCYMILSYNGYSKTSPPAVAILLDSSTSIAAFSYNALAGTQTISVNPASIDFGMVTAPGLTPTQIITVQNTGTLSISPIVSPSISGLVVSANSCLSVILPSNSCSFSLAYNAQATTPNRVISGLFVTVAPSSTAPSLTIPVAVNLNFPPVLVTSAADTAISSGGAVAGDKFVFAQGNSSAAYNPVSNIFYSWGLTYTSSNTSTSPSTPQPMNIGSILGGKTFKKIAQNVTHACAIASDDNAYCWSDPYSTATLGRDQTISPAANPVIPAPVSKTGVFAGKIIKDIGVGQGHTCAIADDNMVYCWGLNAEGELGNNSTATQYEPVAVDWSGVLAGKTAKSLNVEQSETCIIASDSLAYCWGFSLATNISSLVPVQIPMNGNLVGKTVKSLTTNGATHCLVASDDKAYCWGSNAYGQLGDGTTIDSAYPIPVISTGALAGKVIVDLKIGSASVFAFTLDNKVFSWGFGALGQNTSQSLVQQPPAEIYMAGDLAGKTIKSLYVASQDDFACAIASDNLPYCWGSNQTNNLSYGKLGIGLSYSQLNFALEPKAVYTGGALAGKQIKALYLAPFQSVLHVCSLASDNNVYCWGDNTAGQLGNGTKIGTTVPVLAPTP